MKNYLRLSVLLVQLVGLAEVHARGAVLFSVDSSGYSVQVPEYNFVVSRLVPGSWIEFSDGTSFQLGRHLGSGASSRVFEIAGQPDKAIRIPLSDGTLNGHPIPLYLDSMIDGYALIEKHGVPAIKLHARKSWEYIVVDRIPGPPHSYSFKDLVKGRVPSELRQQMKKALFEFASKTSGFAYIGDIDQSQIRFLAREGRWILMDWNGAHLLSKVGDREAERILMKGANPTLFSASHPDSDMLDFFHPYIGMEREPISEEYRWIADLEGELEAHVRSERARIKAEKALKPALQGLGHVRELGARDSYTLDADHISSKDCQAPFSKLLGRGSSRY